MADHAYDALFAALRSLNIVAYAQVAGAVVFAYDYLLTLEMEMELVWRSQWNFIKCLYLFQRYLPFYDVFYVSLHRHLGKNLTVRECEILFYQLGASFMVGIIASETLCSLRIWALWNNDKRFYYIFPIGVVCVWIPGIVAMYSTVLEARYGTPPYPGFLGCFMQHSKSYLVWVWVALLVYDAVSLVFVLAPALGHYRNGITSSSRLTHVVYRDGVSYYAIQFIFSLLNIIFTVRLEAASRSALATLGRTIHAVLASRVLLNMRKTVQTQDMNLSDLPTQSRNEMRFAPAALSRNRLDDDDDEPRIHKLTRTTSSSSGEPHSLQI